MSLVTLLAGRRPRLAALEGQDVVNCGFAGDMRALIEAGAPVGRSTAVEGTRLLAPLRPRSSHARTLDPAEVVGTGTIIGGSAIELDRFVHECDPIALETEGTGAVRDRVGRRGG
jgi:hypothetical protein